MDESGLSSLITVLVLIAANALLTLGYEALVNTRKPRLAELTEQGSRRAATALRLGQDATNLLITYQLSVIVLRFFRGGRGSGRNRAAGRPVADRPSGAARHGLYHG